MLCIVMPRYLSAACHQSRLRRRLAQLSLEASEHEGQNAVLQEQLALTIAEAQLAKERIFELEDEIQNLRTQRP